LSHITTIILALLPQKRSIRISLVVFLVLLLFIATTMRFHITGDFEGLYVLKSDKALLCDIQDDLFLGEKDRLLFRMEFEPLYDFFRGIMHHGVQETHLQYEWNNRNGNGFVVSHLPGGYKFLTCFGRFLDTEGHVPEGLFVGGGLPFAKSSNAEVTMNETGMAFYTGKEWHHLWCNVNEGLISRTHQIAYPSAWKFLGSRVLEANENKLIIKSSHEVLLDGVPIHIDRYAFFNAGETFFVLAVVIRNDGPVETGYQYVYGDEPWVGDYGSSLGNVGWVKDKLYYYEGSVDPKKYSFAGLWDVGNPAVPAERRPGVVFTGMANFIEWLGDIKPDLVYFSNTIGDYAEESKKVPLSSETNRVIFLQWDTRSIKPNEKQTILLGLGMAGFDPITSYPVKPVVQLSDKDLAYIREH